MYLVFVDFPDDPGFYAVDEEAQALAVADHILKPFRGVGLRKLVLQHSLGRGGKKPA
jgi:hypothetical protein